MYAASGLGGCVCGPGAQPVNNSGSQKQRADRINLIREFVRSREGRKVQRKLYLARSEIFRLLLHPVFREQTLRRGVALRGGGVPFGLRLGAVGGDADAGKIHSAEFVLAEGVALGGGGGF